MTRQGLGCGRGRGRGHGCGCGTCTGHALGRPHGQGMAWLGTHARLPAYLHAHCARLQLAIRVCYAELNSAACMPTRLPRWVPPLEAPSWPATGGHGLDLLATKAAPSEAPSVAPTTPRYSPQRWTMPLPPLRNKRNVISCEPLVAQHHRTELCLRTPAGREVSLAGHPPPAAAAVVGTLSVKNTNLEIRILNKQITVV